VKAKKGVLCAFELVTLDVHPAERVGERATVTRTERWYLGTVLAATRTGKVREVVSADGVRWKMDGKHFRVARVFTIPADKVNGPRLLMDAEGRSWDLLEDVERFTAEHLRPTDTLL